MPTWGDILKEVQRELNSGKPQALDLVRRKYLVEMSRHTGRALILYATKWTQPSGNVAPEMLSINDEDLQALMTVMNGVKETSLDLILHSPGGSIEAAEALVTYLRSKFSHIRVIVPQQAMSAATMIACAADEIVLGKHSFLGPTDPQFILSTPLGQRIVTAQNIVDQFERAQKECADPSKIGAWIPILSQYGPDLLQKCQHASELSKSLITGWLASYMFKGQPDARKKARRIANWLASHKRFRTHGRHLCREDLRKNGLDKIVDLESDPILQDLALSLFHATTQTFDMSPAVKIIENHLGRAFVKMVGVTMSAPKPPVPKPPVGQKPTTHPPPTS